MKKRFLVLISACCVLLSSCDKFKMGEDSFADIPQDVMVILQKDAKKNFPSNETLAENWIERQVQAYRKLSSDTPSIPTVEYAKFLRYAKEVSGNDYVAILSSVREMVSDYENLLERMNVLTEQEKVFVKSLFDDTNSIELKNSTKKANDWIDVFIELRNIEKKFLAEDFQGIKNQLLQKYRHSPLSAMNDAYAQARAQDKIKTFYYRNADAKKVEELKQQLRKTYPYDFIKQLDSLERYDVTLLLPDEDEKKVSPTQKANEQLAEKILKNCVFTKHSETGEVYIAVLVKMRGRPVIICSKEFLPRKLPVYFGNSTGHIKCTSAYVSKKHPVVVLFPEKDGMTFTPLEVVDDAELASIKERQLYVFRPEKKGFSGHPVKAESIETMFFKFAKVNYDNSSSDNSKSDLTKLDSSIVVDSQTGKLVSLGLRYVDYDIANIKGKARNIFTGEEMNIPTFATFAKDFNSGIDAYLRGSSIHFVKMSALQDLQKFDTLKFLRQKDFVRKYADTTEEYFKFFSKNSFSEALRSFRLSNIAAKYRRSFENDKLSTDAFNAKYALFVKDVLKSMSSDLYTFGGANISNDNFYAVCRSEMAYQLAFRIAMLNYLKNYFEENSIEEFVKAGLKIK